MKRLVLLPALLLALAPEASALRVATYNILNYSTGRTTQFATVLEEMQPDVLVVQEILSQGGVNSYLAILDSVNPGEWTAAPFVDGPDTDNAIFWRAAACSLTGHHVISTALRNIDEYTIRPASHATAAADLRLYSVHLKASQGIDNEQKRLAEVQQMRTRMETFPAGGSYSVLGDFNIYRATEPAYLYLTNPAQGAAGVVEDPIDREGNWHNNEAFADVHTQSPRTTQFGGGANGGLDDRFDLMLVGPAARDGEGWDILEATYTALGQDGLHFNGALEDPPFVVVSQAVAQALHDASDHLPVFADWQVPARLSVVASLDVGPVIVGGSASAPLSVANVAPVPADELDYSFTSPAGFTAPAGAFQAAAGAPPAVHDIGLDASTVGAKAGDLEVATDDPDAPFFAVALSGSVLGHGQPSTTGAGVQLVALADFGTVAADTALLPVEVHNFDWQPLQAAIDPYDAQIAGDPRFFVESFTPALVEGTPLVIQVGFDAAVAPEGTYTGELTVSTRDRTDLDGWIDLDDLVWELSATVGDGVGAPVVAAAVRPGISAVGPNPFRSGVAIRFGLSRAGRAELRIWDVRGRLVRTLAADERAAGEHRVTWDGRDGSGRPQAPGIYFVRFEGDGVVATRKIVRIR